jgi:CBS domain-containing protein
MSIGTFCSRDVVVTEKDTSIVEAAQLMREHHVGDLVVVDRSKGQTVPIGILTDRDIVVGIVACEVDYFSVTVGDVMGPDLVIVKEEDSLWDTLQRMRQRTIRRIPVVDNNGTLVGILSIDDILDLISEELTAIANIIAYQPTREEEVRH